nr:hybrid signal transduction histidine kinase M [Tanacetum cinerariifolium]
MAINDNPSPPPPTVDMEKPFGVSNIKSHVPLVLDLDQLSYDAWCEFFTSHCHSFGVHGLLDGTFVSTSDNAAEWKKLDSLVKVWIYEIKVVSDLLSNIESPVDDKNLVMYAVNGVGDKYDHVASIIRHSKNPPTLLETRSMLLLEEFRLNQKQGRGHAQDTPSSSTVLMASGSRNNNKGATNKEICKKFQRGNCRFGDRCKYVHARASQSGKPTPWNANNRPHMDQFVRGPHIHLRA